MGVQTSESDPPSAPEKTERRLKLRIGSGTPRVLLAEDNDINALLALRLLEKAGCDVKLCVNGRDAVEAVRRVLDGLDTAFDVVLMDAHMPVLDGLEATRLIKKLYAEHEGGALKAPPIIAVTANAFDDDRRRCLAAGMDDYLAKPFKKEQLRNVLANWIERADTRPSTPRSAAPAAAPDEATRAAAIDMKALDNIRALQQPGAPDLLEKIVTLFLDDAPRLVRSMRDAIAAGDGGALQHAAHTLKSDSATLGALELSELCKQTETQARAGCLADADHWIDRIEDEYARVRAALPAGCAHIQEASCQSHPQS